MLVADRRRLTAISSADLGAKDGEWLGAMMRRYHVAEANDPVTPQKLKELKLCVDALSPYVTQTLPNFLPAQEFCFAAWTRNRRQGLGKGHSHLFERKKR